MIHVLFGVSWVAVMFMNTAFLLPEIQKAQAMKDMPLFRSAAKRLSMIGMVTGFGTLITGVAYLLIKFGTNGDNLVGDPEPRTIIASMWLVIAVLVVGMVFMRPTAMKIGKQAAQMDPAAPFPEDFRRLLNRVAILMRVTSAGVFLTLILMVLATQGGI